MTASRKWVLALVVLALVVPLLRPVMPDVVSDYRLFLVSTMIIASIAVLGLNLLTGFNGQFSLGHGAFYAVGAYTAAVLMDHWSVPYWATIPAAAIVCFIVGYLFGLPALKLEGHYLALATFALAVAMPQLLKYKAIEQWTGGVQGIVIIKPDAPFGLPLSQDRWLYYFTLAVLLLMFVAAVRLVSSRTGRALKAIRDNEQRALSLGYEADRYKLLAFVLSAALAPFAPLPFVTRQADGHFALVEEETAGADHPHSFGRMVAFHGQMGMFTRALAYILSHGADGLKQASEDAVLSANYVMASLKDVMTPAFDGPCMHECLFDDSFLKDTGVSTLDFAKAMIDEGYHPMTIYFPLVAHGAMLIEPTESESKESLDNFIHVLREMALERARSVN